MNNVKLFSILPAPSKPYSRCIIWTIFKTYSEPKPGIPQLSPISMSVYWSISAQCIVVVVDYLPFSITQPLLLYLFYSLCLYSPILCNGHLSCSEILL